MKARPDVSTAGDAALSVKGFIVWAFVGAAFVFGSLSFILPFLIVGILAVLVALAFARRNPSFSRAWSGVGTGSGAVLLFVAWVQRRGPGWVCWHTATASGCDQYSNPWPWFLVGLMFVVLSLIAFFRRVRSAWAQHLQ
jgi:hypothetical protein